MTARLSEGGINVLILEAEAVARGANFTRPARRLRRCSIPYPFASESSAIASILLGPRLQRRRREKHPHAAAQGGRGGRA